MSALPVVAASGAARAIALIGDAWVLRILRSAFRGTCRFGGFMQELGVSRAVLSQRLDLLCAQGLLERDASGGGHARYRLSEMGRDLWGVLILMWLWERQRGTGLVGSPNSRDRPRSRLIHRDCGAVIEPRHACMRCAQTVSPFETEAVLRPSAGEAGGGLAKPSERARYRQSSQRDRESLPRLLRLFGDRWNCFMLAAAFQGARTFSDFQRALALGPAQISDRLSELQALGFLSPRAYAGQRQAYRLTPDALATFSITVELMQWGNRWLWRGKAPLTVRHKSCGHLLQAALDCPHCGKSLSRRNLVLSD